MLKEKAPIINSDTNTSNQNTYLLN